MQKLRRARKAAIAEEIQHFSRGCAPRFRHCSGTSSTRSPSSRGSARTAATTPVASRGCASRRARWEGPEHRPGPPSERPKQPSPRAAECPVQIKLRKGLGLTRNQKIKETSYVVGHEAHPFEVMRSKRTKTRKQNQDTKPSPIFHSLQRLLSHKLKVSAVSTNKGY